MKDETGDIGQEIVEYYEAIALALDALGYMLRKTKETAFLMHVSLVAKPQIPQGQEYVLNSVCSQCRSQLRQMRAELGRLLDMVGDDRNHWDAVTETESQLTAPAYEAMRKRAPKTPSEQGGAHG